MVENTTITSAGSARPMRPMTCKIKAPGSVSPVTSVAINPSRYIQEDTRKYPHHVFQKAAVVLRAKRA